LAVIGAAAVSLFATGSEVALAVEAKKLLAGRKVSALELQRKVTGPFMDLEKVEEFFKDKPDLFNKVYHKVSEYIWDFDVIYRLQQEGKLTEAEVQSLMSTNISWSLGVKEER